MATLTIEKKPQSNKYLLEMEINADQVEQVSAALGLFTPEFEASLEKSLRESKRGQVRKLKSLRELRA